MNEDDANLVEQTPVGEIIDNSELKPSPAPIPKKTILSLKGLRRKYGDFEAVSGIDLDVYSGEIFSLLGPNGSGKTTTIKMIMGLLSSTSGTAQIKGYNCFSEREVVMSHVGYVPDEPIFYDYLRSSEVVRFVGEMHGMRGIDALNSAMPMIEQLELTNDMEEFAVNYSRGMKKKLALICAMLHEPEMLILDEPTNGLDPFATRTLHAMLKGYCSRGNTVFFSTHILDQAERISNRVGILYKGRLAAVGELSELKASLNSDSSLEEIFFLVAQKASENAS